MCTLCHQRASAAAQREPAECGGIEGRKCAFQPAPAGNLLVSVGLGPFQAPHGRRSIEPPHRSRERREARGPVVGTQRTSRVVTCHRPLRGSVTLPEGDGLMPERLGLRRPRWWVVLTCAAVGLGLAAVPSVRAAAAPAPCDTQVNDTPGKLLPCITTDDLWNHMQAFQAIAAANPSPADGHPSRNSGEPGYKASADYVAQVMTQAGYDVHIQTYKFDYFAYTDIPTLSEVSPTAHDYAVTTDFNPGQSTGTRTDFASAGRRHRHPADGHSQFGERMHRGRLQRLRAGPDRTNPAGHVHLQPEGPEMPRTPGPAASSSSTKATQAARMSSEAASSILMPQRKKFRSRSRLSPSAATSSISTTRRWRTTRRCRS